MNEDDRLMSEGWKLLLWLAAAVVVVGLATGCAPGKTISIQTDEYRLMRAKAEFVDCTVEAATSPHVAEQERKGAFTFCARNLKAVMESMEEPGK